MIGKNNPNWKGGFSKCIECDVKISRNAKRCRICENKRRNHKGKNNLMYGKLGKNNPNYGSKRTEITKRNISKSLIGKFAGKKSPSYIDGRSLRPYPRIFYKLRIKIRKRDNYTCQKCNVIEEKYLIIYGKVLDVHHIDYDKENCKESNLITLCNQCNIKANFNRKYWTKYFKEKLINNEKV